MIVQDDHTEDAWLATIRQYHPQLTEKALIDLVNGLEVVSDHLRCRATPRPMFGRLWHAVTGRTSREQYLIDINLKAGLEAVTAWLQDLQAFQAKSDLALAVVSDKLAETRTELGGYLIDVQAAIDKTLEEVHTQFDMVTKRIEELETRDKAKSQLDLLIYRGKAPIYRALPPIAQVFLEIDELWWGDFGRYCRLARDAEVVGQLIELARYKIGELFASRLGLSVREILAVEDLLRPIAALPKEESELVTYLADHGSPHRAPLMHAIVSATGGDIDLQAAPQTLPRALSPLGVSARLLRESRLATTETRH